MRRPTLAWCSFAVATAIALVVPLAASAQAAAHDRAALALLDQRKCEEAVDAINAGMLADEPRAHFIAGQIFQSGYCVVVDKPRAAQYYERGARLGDGACARALALMHARGDGLPQSWPDAGRWFAAAARIGNGWKRGDAVPPASAFTSPDALVKTYIEAVGDLAAVSIVYPRAAIDERVTGVVKVRFDPRVGRVTLVSASDSSGRAPGTAGASKDDFVRAVLAAYADALRQLSRPSMSPHVDNSVEREVAFDRTALHPDEPAGLQALAR